MKDGTGMAAQSLAAWRATGIPAGSAPKDAASPAGAASGDVSEADSDRERIVRSRHGDLDAYAEIYERHEAAIYRHAYRLLEDADEADDVRQETFLRAYRSLAAFRGEAVFKTYLLTICGNLCRDRLRQRARRPEHRYGLDAPERVGQGGGLAPDDVDPLLHRLTRQAQAETVWQALRQMPAAQRELLLLRHVEGLDLDAVAQVVGCTRLSAPVRLFRARSRFKEIYLSLLQEEGE